MLLLPLVLLVPLLLVLLLTPPPPLPSSRTLDRQAARLLALLRSEHFRDVPLFRCVPGFLCQVRALPPPPPLLLLLLALLLLALVLLLL